MTLKAGSSIWKNSFMKSYSSQLVGLTTKYFHVGFSLWPCLTNAAAIAVLPKSVGSWHSAKIERF